ncbi:MAG: rRNA maturation RNase YbeY [Gemmatimonadota bacterium]
MSEPRVDVNFGDQITPAPTAAADIEVAVREALDQEGVDRAAISITLLSDAEIAQLNHQYLQHEGPTDVLSFPLYEKGEPPVGDIYIGYEQAKRQSSDLAVPLDTELARLAIHGTLHVLGYVHPDDGAREQSEMWQRQEEILRAFLRRAAPR